MKCFNDISGSSGVFCGGRLIPENMRLSRMLRHWMSNMVSCIILLSLVSFVTCLERSDTVPWSWLFSCLRVSIWDWENSRLDFKSRKSAWSS